MIKNNFFIESEEKFGISLENDSVLKFFAPKILLDNKVLDNNFDQIKLLKNFIKVLKGYANSKSEEISYFRSESQSASIDIIEAYLNIINDYMENGDFIIFSKKNANNNRNINWSKTIKDNDVIIQRNSILYGSFKSKTKEKSNDDTFFKVYINALNDAQQLFLNPSLTINSIDINNEEALYYINKYLDSRFKDREIYIATQLKIIYSGRNFSTINESSFPVKYHEYFEYIFQFLVEKNIQKYSVKRKEKWNGIYLDYDSDKKTNGLDLRLDHIISKEDIYYILDSKFYGHYNFDTKPSNFPMTGDIIKQVGYKLYLSKILKKDVSKINNVFIFPKINNDPNNIKLFAKHYVENDNEKIFDIECIYVDINFLIENYIDEKNDNSLINLIFDNIRN